MKFFLLTHEREVNRTTNTGQLAIDSLGDIVKRVVWERVNPNKYLVNLIENNEVLLLDSKGESSVMDIQEYENVVIIDGTWQEAQKILNKSAYLKHVPRFKLERASESEYKLRRNQPKGGLCTVECIIEILRMKGQNEIALDLELKFKQFNG